MLPQWFTRPLIVGDTGPDVVVVQRKLGVRPTGLFGPGDSAVVRGYQYAMGLQPSGQVDDATAVELGEAAGHDLLPDWWTGEAVTSIHPLWPTVVRLLDAPVGGAVDALKRFQGNNGLSVTGVVDEWTARRLGQ